MVRQHASFLTKNRAEHTCSPYGCNNCEIYTCHCQGFERSKNLGGKGGDLGQALPLLLSPLFPLLGAGFLLRCVEAAATERSWLPRASHRASAAFTPTSSVMDSGRRIKNTERRKSLSGETPGGRCCLSFPMRTLG